MTRRLIAVTSFVGLTFAAFPPSGEARGPVLSAPPELPRESRDPATDAAIELFVHAKLLGVQVSAGLTAPVEVDLGANRLRRLGETVPGERPLRVGAKKRLGLQVDLAAPETSFGAKHSGSDGVTVWTGVVRSESATALRLEFAGFDLPEGHELFLYSPNGQVRGPYTGRGPLGKGTFWSHTVFSSEVVLQLHVPAGQAAPPPFTIRRVGHMGPKFRLASPAGRRLGGIEEKAFCSGLNASCVENAACGASGAVAMAEDAVAEMLFASGGGFFICTGGLLADTDTGSVRELFLTANHCISRGSEAASLEAFFQFKVNCSTTNCPDFDNGSYPSTVGATILKTAKRSDYTLMELAEAAPGGSAYLGWNATPVASSNGTQLFRISHPSGAPQAYSEHSVDTSKGTCGGWPRGRWIYSNDTYGATEGGSSGSPVVNAAGEVVGQLTGACGTNVNDVCDADSNATVDGAFAAYFSQISSILDPDGGDPGGGTCTPGSGQKGDSCTEDNDCASCKCKGGASKTCK